MKKIIKLTEDNVDIYDMAVRIWVGGTGADNKQRCQSMVKQILIDAKKAEKWDKWQEDLHNLAQENKTPYYLMLKENKQLKEKVEKIKNWYGRTQGQVSHESALEMIKILESK